MGLANACRLFVVLAPQPDGTRASMMMTLPPLRAAMASDGAFLKTLVPATLDLAGGGRRDLRCPEDGA
jgi:hypothetical protein